MGKSALSVLVLHEAIGADARADELDTLAQVAQVSAALQGLGWGVTVLPVGLDLGAALSSVRAQEPKCVFNLVESLGGDGRLIHFIPSLLESARVPFTGSGSDAIYLSSHKLLAKQWMRLNGIATPPCFAADGQSTGDDTVWIVKSVWEHASLGLDDGCVVSGPAAARARIDACTERYGGGWFGEQFIDGREFNISVLERAGEPWVLPIAEMTFMDYPRDKPKIVGYAAKWDEDAVEFHATRRIFPHLSAGLAEILTATVLRCWTSFGLRGYARIDIRVDATGTPWVLEINANPCLARDAGYTAAALESETSYEQLIGQVVHTALRSGFPAARAGADPAHASMLMPAA